MRIEIYAPLEGVKDTEQLVKVIEAPTLQEAAQKLRDWERTAVIPQLIWKRPMTTIDERRRIISEQIHEFLENNVGYKVNEILETSNSCDFILENTYKEKFMITVMDFEE